jgi:hypothetical protein
MTAPKSIDKRTADLSQRAADEMRFLCPSFNLTLRKELFLGISLEESE